MIELRENSICEDSYTESAPINGLTIFKENAGETFEKLMRIHSFLQKRWRELSLADGKAPRGVSGTVCADANLIQENHG